MKQSRPMLVLASMATMVAVVACGDMAGPEREAALRGVDATSRSDTARPPRPDTGRPTRPDTGKPTPPDTGKPTPPDTGRPTPPDTGKPTPPDTGKPTPPDTGRPTPPDTISDAYLRGTVLGVDSTGASVTIEPLANVVVTLFQRTGTGRDSLAADRTGPRGAFEFTRLRPGAYILRAVPPPGSGYPSATVSVTAYSERSLVLQAPLVIYLHKTR